MNYSGKLNLLKFKNACLISVKGNTAVKKGIFIPFEDNNIFISSDEDLKAKGAYVDFNAWENQATDKYGYTHCIRQSISKEVKDRMNEEERKSVPYIGNMKPYEIQNGPSSVHVSTAEIDESDDLPF